MIAKYFIELVINADRLPVDIEFANTVKPRFNGLMRKCNCRYWKMSVIRKDTDFT